MRVLFLSACLLAAPAFAQDSGPKADTNGDGQVTFAEFEAIAVARFDAMDADFDGVLTQGERDSFREGNRDRRRDARFERMDRDGDGVLSLEEMNSADTRRERFRERIRARVDTDGDGTVSPAEREAARDRFRARRGDRAAFPRFDQDGDGLVTRFEYATATQALFERMDANGDGVLTQGEGRKKRKRRRFRR